MTAKFCITCRWRTDKPPKGWEAHTGQSLFCTHELVRHAYPDRVYGVAESVLCMFARESAVQSRVYGKPLSPCGEHGRLWVSAENVLTPDPIVSDCLKGQ